MEISEDKKNEAHNRSHHHPHRSHHHHAGGPGGGSGTKRDRSGHPKKTSSAGAGGGGSSSRPEPPRNAYTAMFEGFRDEIDEHHDRKERVIKASRDITALSKKIIFSLLRTRTLSQPLPPQISKEFHSRLAEIKTILSPIASSDIQGINRHRYQVRGLEEYVEAVSLYHYLLHQTLITPEQAAVLLHPEVEIELTTEEYLGGVFDLFGEMMRFATNMAGLCGTLAPNKGAEAAKTQEEEKLEVEVDGADGEKDGGKMDVDGEEDKNARQTGTKPDGRSILSDMQELGSCVEILPIYKGGKDMRWKIDTMRSSVQKVEKLGYGLVVRGSERPAGWMPDMSDDRGPEIEV